MDPRHLTEVQGYQPGNSEMGTMMNHEDEEWNW